MSKKVFLVNPKFVPLYFLFFFFLLLLTIVFSPPSFLKQGFFPKNLTKVSLPKPAPYPESLAKNPPPSLTARSVVAIDVDSGTVLLEKDAQIATPPASTTKMMTALVVLENYQLDQVIRVGDLSSVEGQKMKLKPGEEITVENLLYGLLVSSANDAAIAFAQDFPNSENGFVWAMNQKAEELGLLKTNFTNPVGYDEPGHYSTAFDLTKLAIEAMKNQTIARMAGTEKITVADVSGKILHPMSNINLLVGKLAGVKGVKTGWTQEAGECLVTLVERDNHRVMISLLGSNDRFAETTALVEWIFANFSWEEFTP